MASQDKTTGQRQDRLNSALRDNLKRRKQQGRGRGATALPLDERPSLMAGPKADLETSLKTGPDGQPNGESGKSADADNDMTATPADNPAQPD